jgi:protein-disulfide isomerase
MTCSAMPDDSQLALVPLDEKVDHVRGPPAGHLILEYGDLRRYAAQLRLNVAAFDRDRASAAVLGRIQRDVHSGLASGQVLGTPTLFIDGVVRRGGYGPPTLLAALTTSE